VKILGVIPARYHSTRFPGKPLALITGKPMIQHVWERCHAATELDRVIVATDHEGIIKACRAFDAEAMMTSADLHSGTDRVAAVARMVTGFEGVLNIQGDEPAINPETINAVAHLLKQPGVEIASAVVELRNEPEAADPNMVKVALSESGVALYFSRAPIPFVRNPSPSSPAIRYRHLGIYAFRFDTLLKLSKLKPSRLELMESLEQLRWLEAGYRIHCAQVEDNSVGVDTPEDLKAVEQKMRNQD
jgi:3-deoxy-manno-octulosonate cytidylyltransferase (CMP-KDO synthetase)